LGNKVTLYNDGKDCFTDMWDAIENAKSMVWLESYIIEPDHVGRKTMELLLHAKNRGCDVRLIYDWIGSKNINDKMMQPLRDAGIQVVPFNPPWKMRSFGFGRSHRKILIVDQKIGFTGGMNIGDEYAGSAVGGLDYFRDTHVKLIGPAVIELSKVFLNSLNEAGELYLTSEEIRSLVSGNISEKKEDDIKKELNENEEELSENEEETNVAVAEIGKESKKESKKDSKTKKSKTKSNATTTEIEKESNEINKDGILVQVLQSNRWRNMRHIQESISLSLRNAQKRCYIVTPYFLPSRKLKRGLIGAAKRGVDVRLLTSGLTDVPLMKMASEHIYSSFIKNGIRVFEYHGRTLHSKTYTVDGIYSTIGSFNWDSLSDSYNLETNVTTLDHEIANQLETDFHMDIEESIEIKLSDLHKTNIFRKFANWVAFQIFRLFFPFKK